MPVSEHLEVRDRQLPFDQIDVVLGIEDGPLDVLAGEAPYGLEGVPERNQHELRAVPLSPTKHLNTAVPPGCCVLRQTGLLEVLHVRVDIIGTRDASPHSCDHLTSRLRRIRS